MKHVHEFRKPRPTSKVKVCSCGKFQHIITNPADVIVCTLPKEVR